MAEWVAGALLAHGHEVVVRSVDEAVDTRSYDAFVVGSAVHDQAWLPVGMAFLAKHRKALYGKPVWLFSVGLPGALRGPLRQWAEAKEADVLAVNANGARGPECLPFRRLDLDNVRAVVGEQHGAHRYGGVMGEVDDEHARQRA